QLSAILINRDAPAHHNLHAVLRTKAQQPRRGSKHHHPNLRVPIFECEIKMPRVVRPEVRNLTFHPDVAIFPLKVRAHRRHQIAYRPGAPLRRPETEPELIRGSHAEEFTAGARLRREPRTEVTSSSDQSRKAKPKARR